jgi:hypothetical protein
LEKSIISVFREEHIKNVNRQRKAASRLQPFPLKRRGTSTGLQGAISHMAMLFISELVLAIFALRYFGDWCCHLGVLATITLQVVPFQVYAPIPGLQQFLECILEVVFCEGVQLHL